MAIRAKTSVQLHAKGEAVSHSRTDIETGGLNLTIDEPEARGGTNAGPTPTSTALAALVGCTNVIGNKVADKMGLAINILRIETIADFDRRGVTLTNEVDVPFSSLRLNVEIETAATQDEIDKLASEVAKFCPLSKLFRQAGTKIEEEWIIQNPS